jgi:two-component system, NarL family, sensor histidine kinase LiaS
MGRITFPHLFGRKSSLYSEWQRLGKRLGGYRLFSGNIIALGVAATITLILFGVLIFNHDQSSHIIDDHTLQLRQVDDVLHQIDNVRYAIEHELVLLQSGSVRPPAQDTIDNTANNDVDLAVAHAQTALDDVLGKASPELYLYLESLHDSLARYVNTYRSLARVVLANNTPTNVALITALGANATELEGQMNTLSTLVWRETDTVRQAVNNNNVRLRLVIMALLLATFSVSIVITVQLAHRTTRNLDLIGQAAKAIAAGNLDTKITLTRDDEIGQLGGLFNKMAEGLRLSIATENAASEQNRKQILKLARQERVNAILEERQRIAQELHDSVKQQLFSINLAAGAATNLLTNTPDLAKTYLDHVKQAATYAQSEMTTLLEELVPVPLQDQRLEDALSQYLRLLCDAHHVKLLWRVEGTNTLSIAQEHALFRVVQEAAANVIRHSNATLMRVSMSFGLHTRVVVEDNGKGFDKTAIPPTSTGLATMRLRLKRVGGVCEINSTPTSGTRLVITLELRKKVT